MFDDFNICPYTGLRSFTEEESIYFKGRDEHIQQATAQLEKNKFLMLTGASGDGKSSIVYAGIIPNARAGFLKATYSNWHIADFRPERTPFQNLCKEIAKALQIENKTSVESELQHGFSALIDLYKSSPLYIDTTTTEYQQASEEERKKMHHSSANLMILVDQFEEFFTNPENYVNGIPSNKATLTINLLLETASIAHDEGIPIYIVFTMRSDFIGQCAAFRELPKYIGFSQFFVPRLNRKLLQEVIEEPCTLSGNSITRRLTERIIHDIDDGVDQLPILQHALNQIWKAANNGKEEMDLFHYAMVGGLEPNELPDEDRMKFNSWFDDLPSNIQSCFHERSLHNVLDTHANKIFESASSYLKEKTGQVVSVSLAQEIIKVAFTSLTKIDQSREVRNRMTLEEVRDIINSPDANINIISGIINLFREPGNTFIRPFILDDPATHDLSADSVLDITHESLIRNWQKLGDWTKEEYDKFVVFKDFKQQVDRWLQHNKSGGFLLPIGSLTFFETWYTGVRINKNWVNRYNEQVTDTPKNLEESAQIVEDSDKFLDRSARKHIITRAVVKIGPRRIAAAIILILFMGLSSFYYYDYRKKTNDYVLRQIHHDARPIINEEKVDYDLKANYVVKSERVQRGQFAAILNDLVSDENRFRIALAAAEDLVHNDRQGNLYLKKQALLYTDSVARLLYKELPKTHEDQNEALKDLLIFAEVLEYYLYYFENDEEIKQIQPKINGILAGLTLQLLKNPYADMDMQKFNESIEMGLNHFQFSKEQLVDIINIITDPNSSIQVNYAKGKIVTTARQASSFTYNGKYQIIADVYAALGNVNECLTAIEQILADQPKYNTYATDGTTIAGYFVTYGNWQALDEFVTGYADKTGYKPYEIYRQVVNRSGYLSQTIYERFTYNFIGQTDVWYNPVLDYMTDSTLIVLYDYYIQSITTTASIGDERNFYLAVYYKQKGLFKAKSNQDKQIDPSHWLDEVNNDFAQSFNWYKKTSTSYLNENINMNFHQVALKPRKELYTYPDYIEHVASYPIRARSINYLSSSFMEYIINQNLMENLYPSANELEQTLTWLRDYKTASGGGVFLIYEGNKIKLNILQQIDSAIMRHKDGQVVNNNMLMVLLSSQLFEHGQADLAISYAKRINAIALADLFNEEYNFPHVVTFTLIGDIYAALIVNNEHDLAEEIRNSFGQLNNKTKLTHRVTNEFFQNKQVDLGMPFYGLADSIMTVGVDVGGTNRSMHAYTTSLRGEKDDFKKSAKLIRNFGGFFKYISLYRNVRATAFHGHYFEAYSGIPKFSSSEVKLNTIAEMLYGQTVFANDSAWRNYDYYKDYLSNALFY